MVVIIVSGSVGTGKSTLSKKLAKKTGYGYIDVSRIIKDIANDGNMALEYLRQEIGDLQQLSEQVVTYLEESKAAGMHSEVQAEALKDAREMRDRLSKFTLEKDQD